MYHFTIFLCFFTGIIDYKYCGYVGDWEYEWGVLWGSVCVCVCMYYYTLIKMKDPLTLEHTVQLDLKCPFPVKSCYFSILFIYFSILLQFYYFTC